MYVECLLVSDWVILVVMMMMMLVMWVTIDLVIVVIVLEFLCGCDVMVRYCVG